jgi:hypothetical protein
MESLVGRLAKEAATEFLVEVRDESKATHTYLSSIGGKYSILSISDNQHSSVLN